MFFLQLTLSGLMQGAIYALIALSLTVVYRATTIVNFGHGDFVMAGAFVVFDMEPIFIDELVVTGDMLFISAIVAVLMVVFFLVFYRTTIGTVIQAVYQSERGATLIGVNVDAFHQTMWGVGLAMGAMGGILIAPISLLHPDLGATFLIRGFAAMTLGGFGSLGGAVVGGLLLGVAEQNFGFYINSALIDITAYLVIVAVLVIRPAGLFGKTVTVRV